MSTTPSLLNQNYRSLHKAGSLLRSLAQSGWKYMMKLGKIRVRVYVKERPFIDGFHFEHSQLEVSINIVSGYLFLPPFYLKKYSHS